MGVLLSRLTEEYDWRLRSVFRPPKVVLLADGRGQIQNQSGWPQNTPFNSVSVGSPALMPSGCSGGLRPCSGTLTEGLLWVCGSRGDPGGPRQESQAVTLSVPQAPCLKQTGLLRHWKAVPHMPAHGAKGQGRGHEKEGTFWVDRQE